MGNAKRLLSFMLRVCRAKLVLCFKLKTRLYHKPTPPTGSIKLFTPIYLFKGLSWLVLTLSQNNTKNQKGFICYLLKAQSDQLNPLSISFLLVVKLFSRHKKHFGLHA